MFDQFSCLGQGNTAFLFITFSSQINDEDVISMADVDAFPMKKSLLRPIKRYPNKKVWIFQYDRSITHNWTFAMTFTALRSKIWKEIMCFSNSTAEIFDIFGTKLRLDQRPNKWGFDQLIMTRAIVESKLCSLPSNRDKSIEN